MKVLVVGSGAREHALIWKFKQFNDWNTNQPHEIICAPGNAGISDICDTFNVAVDNLDGMVRLAQEQKVDFVIIGPELPLVLGLVDRLGAVGIDAFGPSKAAAQLEGSKSFMKNFCREFNIPTARYQRFDASEITAAHNYINAHGAPIVIKADGLAAGKGVTVAMTLDEAHDAVDQSLAHGRFGAAGNAVVIEEFLEGDEYSFFALCDGNSAITIGMAQDYKRAFDGDQGPNTGGMGVIGLASRNPKNDGFINKILADFITPTVTGMAQKGMPFKGILFAGLINTKQGFKLLEYNVRFGDPECEALMLLLPDDFLKNFYQSYRSQLIPFHSSTAVAITVIYASKGYPNQSLQLGEIRGLNRIAQSHSLQTFHAATCYDKDGKLVSNGGRVLAITATGGSFKLAHKRAYEAIKKIDFPCGFYRKDIGEKYLNPVEQVNSTLPRSIPTPADNSPLPPPSRMPIPKPIHNSREQLALTD